MNFIDISDSIKDNYTGEGRDEKIISHLEKNRIALNNSIRNIFTTERGTVPGHPQFGSGVGKFIFSLINPLTSALLKEEILSSISLWEPRIIILDITVNEDSDYNRVVLRMIYYIKTDPNKINHEFLYKIDR